MLLALDFIHDRDCRFVVKITNTCYTSVVKMVTALVEKSVKAYHVVGTEP